MSEEPDDVTRVLREQATRYVIGAKGQPIAVLLTMEEYEHYLDLLEDEADSQDRGLAARLDAAAAQPARTRRPGFRDYLHQRQAPDGDVQS